MPTVSLSTKTRRAGAFRAAARSAAGAAALFFFLPAGVSAASSVAAAPAARAADVERPPALLLSPESVKAGDTLRVLAAFETAFKGVRISVSDPEGAALPEVETKRGGGPPFWQAARFRVVRPGRYAVVVKKDGRAVMSDSIDVPPAGGGGSATPASAPRGLWRSRQGWDRGWENLYSAWLEALFLDADERSSWDSLHDVMRDAGRNLLHDRLGLGEDDASGPNSVEMTPDCADNPFYLRAYFAWKTGLPFGFHECSWGTLDTMPRGLRWMTNDSLGGAVGGGANSARAFARLLPVVKNTIHAGNGRMSFKADATDYYPLPLARADLRPGSVFADPYGHTLTIVRWVPQTAKKPGLLLAVDAQPDGTIGIKRFWQGNFIFNTAEVVGEPGFKAFRPIVLEGGGRPRLLTNAEIRSSADYGNLSFMQENMAGPAFYEAMEKLINPDPLDAESAFLDLFRALQEQLIVRLESVGNGEKYMTGHPGTIIPMPPPGSAVFQTTGLWEDFSTPNRDLRLLIAIDTILGFPDKVAGNPTAFGILPREKPEATKARMVALERKWAAEMSIGYVRSDGKQQKLTLGDILERREALEMAYNPNDGIEIRWGAPQGSAELAACRRRAPAYQVERMKAMRVWFRKRLHPPT